MWPLRTFCLAYLTIAVIHAEDERSLQISRPDNSSMNTNTWFEALTTYTMFNRPPDWEPKVLVASELYLVKGYEKYKDGSKSLDGFLWRFKATVEKWLDSVEKHSLMAICIDIDEKIVKGLLAILRGIRKRRPEIVKHLWLEFLPIDPRSRAAAAAVDGHCPRKYGKPLPYGVAREVATVWLNKYTCLETLYSKYLALGIVTKDTPLMWSDFGRFWVKPEYLSAYVRELSNPNSRISREIDSQTLPTIIIDKQCLYKPDAHTTFRGKCKTKSYFAAYWMAFKAKHVMDIFPTLIQASKEVAEVSQCYDDETVISYAWNESKTIMLYELDHYNQTFRTELGLGPLK